MEFLLLTLAHGLTLKPAQAAGLLADNQHYLRHIAVKGMKGHDYTRLGEWYRLVYEHARVLVKLLDEDKDATVVVTTLNILKCGLFSANVDLAVYAARLMSRIGQEINAIGGQLQGQAWDWFVDS